MSEANAGLIDIIEPAAPVAVAGNGWLWIAALFAVLAVLAILLFVLWKYKLPAYRAIQRLRKLQQQLHAGEITPHECALMVALELRHGLGVKRLRADNFPERCSKQDRESWPEFMRQLDGILYQHDAELDKEDTLANLFVQTEYWLRRYSRRSTLKKMAT